MSMGVPSCDMRNGDALLEILTSDSAVGNCDPLLIVAHSLSMQPALSMTV